MRGLLWENGITWLAKRWPECLLLRPQNLFTGSPADSANTSPVHSLTLRPSRIRLNIQNFLTWSFLLGFRDLDVKDSDFLAHYAASSLDNHFPTFRKNIISVSLRVGDPKIFIFISLDKFILKTYISSKVYKTEIGLCVHVGKKCCPVASTVRIWGSGTRRGLVRCEWLITCTYVWC